MVGIGTLVGTTLLYLSLMSDDDEYKKLDPTERDAFFILPNGYKIPMRYDLPTLIGKVIPEHIFNSLIKETEDPTKFKKALKEGAARALATPSVMPTFAAAPFEGYLNKDFTTNRDIVGQGLQGLEPELQYSPKNTSELARILAGNTVSPMQVDHFLQKYLATTMGLIAWISNDMLAEQQGRQRPEKTFKEKSVLCSFVGNITSNAVIPNVRKVMMDIFSNNKKFMMINSGGWTASVNNNNQKKFIDEIPKKCQERPLKSSIIFKIIQEIIHTISRNKAYNT
jgi:hypothetical protein